MAVVLRTKRESVIVVKSNGSEQVFKVTVKDVQDGMVSLDFGDDANVTVHSVEAWERIQAERQTTKVKQDADRPKQRAAYSD